MGRVRLSMKRLESSSNRQVTYFKRRTGMLKKAQEISVLCDIDILLLMLSPSGKPTLFQGERSNFDEIIANFARLTPQARAKRKLESLETLRKTFKKLDHDIGVQDFLDASAPSFEELLNQVNVLQSRFTNIESRLSWWSNPDKINKVEDLELMESALRESLNAVHVQKLQNTMHLPLPMSNEQDGQTSQWHPANKIQHMPFPEAPNILPQENIGYSGDTSVEESSHVMDPGEELQLDQARQATTAILDDSVLDDLNSIAYLRHQLSEQYSCNPYDNLNLLGSKRWDPESEVNFKGYLVDYEIQSNFDLPRSVDSVNNSAADTIAVRGFDEKSYAQVFLPLSIGS
ncbi:agamous-like MADS-box protein AGL65 [Lycium ferocissimum]|uniref:agamous-like MADS-box protein AGL65 n=1 Tax=Lycium ferocissimum TaxID=112874 RepID=UPI0028169E88|nr:agamous-like MADS-box protein AGL65 [Lycium ferocissimum]